MHGELARGEQMAVGVPGLHVEHLLGPQPHPANTLVR
jgi:hypothetical protein